MPELPKQLKVFLCHSSSDKPVVRELYRRLSAESWLDVWLDEEKLFPGQDWNLEIEKAVEAAHAILVCLSNNSITKEGYVQRELRIVLDYADYKPEGTLYLIPVRLEACDPPRRLRPWQYADYFPMEGRAEAYKRLLISLCMRAAELGIPIKQSAAADERAPVAQQKSPERSGMKTPAGDTNTLVVAGMEFKHIEAGAFLMGSKDDDKEVSDYEKPQHSLEIAYDYWLARFTVTNAQFEKFATVSGYETSAEQQGLAWGYENGKEWKEIKGANWQHPRGPNSGIAEKGDHPVVSVSWLDAMEYCKWANQTFRNEIQQVRNLVLRLPSEAEWEKAARGAYGNIYPWGNEFDPKRLNFEDNSKMDTVAVGAYPNGASPYGCEQMAGNVWEWTHTLFEKYPYKLDDDRENEKKTGRRVLRGGSFSRAHQDVRCAYRNEYDTGFCFDGRGFRVSLAPISDSGL